MSLSLFFAQEYLKTFTGYITSFRILPCYMGMSTTIPNADGSNFTEPNVNTGYKRFVLTDVDNSVFGGATVVGSSASVSNEDAVMQTIATAPWGTLRYIGLFDQATGGTPYVFAPLTESIAISADQLPILRVGDMTISIGCNNGYVLGSVLPNYLGYFTGVNASTLLGSACYLGLSTTEPTSSGTGFTEPDRGYGYSRVLIGAGSENSYHAMSIAESIGNGTYYVYNNKQITFPEPILDWGTVTHFGLFSAPTSGTPIVWGKLKTAVELLRGYIPIFKYGAFRITLS